MNPDVPYAPDSLGLSQSIEINVQAMHAQLTREHNEPRDGFEPIPFWMTTIFGILLFWGGMYLSANSADYRFDVDDSINPKVPGAGAAPKAEEIPTDEAGLMKLGQRIFNNCVGCHQATGEGGNGIPPLNQSEWVAGDNASTARLSRILLYGLNGNIFVRGQKYNGQMPAWGGQLKDHQIAAVLTYIRKSWDNKKEIVLPAEVAAARAKGGTRPTNGSQSMTQAELESLDVGYTDVSAAPAPKGKEDPKDKVAPKGKEDPKDKVDPKEIPKK